MKYSLQTFEKPPYSLPQKEKTELLLSDMKNATNWHYGESHELKSYYDQAHFDPTKSFQIEDIPYLPVTIFKTMKLQSVPDENIVRTLYSSSTSGTPSTIVIDEITGNYQKKAILSILSDFLGKDRRHFIIFDTPETIKTSTGGELNSRGTAIRGMLSIAKSFTFILKPDLSINYEALEKLSIDKDSNVCFFGFTWLAYNIFRKHKDDKKLQELLYRINVNDKILLHIGGWKKLTDIAVSKDLFNDHMSEFLSLPKNKITDIYGMTEQLGTVYPDCQYGYKHVPLFAEIIIRDTESLEVLPEGKIGFIELISPIPHSYPGIAIISDDLGKIAGVDTCKCGRKGKFFTFEKRSEGAELRGCGDTLQL